MSCSNATHFAPALRAAGATPLRSRFPAVSLCSAQNDRSPTSTRTPCFTYARATHERRARPSTARGSPEFEVHLEHGAARREDNRQPTSALDGLLNGDLVNRPETRPPEPPATLHDGLMLSLVHHDGRVGGAWLTAVHAFPARATSQHSTGRPRMKSLCVSRRKHHPRSTRARSARVGNVRLNLRWERSSDEVAQPAPRICRRSSTTPKLATAAVCARASNRSKSKSRMRALVRMETPVIYFYTPTPMDVSLKVGFPTGRMTEWYPAVWDWTPHLSTGAPSREYDEEPDAAEGVSAQSLLARRARWTQLRAGARPAVSESAERALPEAPVEPRKRRPLASPRSRPKSGSATSSIGASVVSSPLVNTTVTKTEVFVRPTRALGHALLFDKHGEWSASRHFSGRKGAGHSSSGARVEWARRSQGDGGAAARDRAVRRRKRSPW